MNKYILLLLIFYIFNSPTKSAKILGVFPFPAKSHFNLGHALMKGLAEKGHDITIIASHEDKEQPKNGSYKTVYLDGFWDNYYESVAELDLINSYDENSVKHPYMMQQFMMKFQERTLKHHNVQSFLKSNSSFDLVIVEKFYNDALLAFAHHFKAPLVLFTAIATSPCTNNMMGNPEPYAYVPHFVSTYSPEMNFFQRLINSYLYLFQELTEHYYFLPKHEAIMKRFFPNAPSIYDLYYNASLLFTSTHESFGLSVPLAPNIIHIGGFHVKPAKTLQKDLKEFMDNAKEGVVFFSLGSNLKMNEMPEWQREAILRTLGKLKETVIIKWNGDDLPDKPDNIFISNWWPQADLLAHPNLKLFVTHAGLLSVTETVYHGVPVLLIPFFADQHSNAQIAVSNGYGLKLPYSEFSEDKFVLLLNELLQNPKYQRNAKLRSRLFHHRPMTPIDTANFWVEFVIRHKGAPHLRVPGIRLPWYKYFLVDIMLFLICVTLAIWYEIKLVWKVIKNSNKMEKVKKS